jgi:hypothetical protein
MDQLNPYLDVITPLGAARAIGIETGEADQTMWLVFIKATGEPWYFRNPYIRWAPAISEGRGKPSPFFDIPPGLEKHIERYRKNNWLK